jgi:hypothetical protein
MSERTCVCVWLGESDNTTVMHKERRCRDGYRTRTLTDTTVWPLVTWSSRLQVRHARELHWMHRWVRRPSAPTWPALVQCVSPSIASGVGPASEVRTAKPWPQFRWTIEWPSHRGLREQEASRQVQALGDD